MECEGNIPKARHGHSMVAVGEAQEQLLLLLVGGGFCPKSKSAGEDSESETRDTRIEVDVVDDKEDTCGPTRSAQLEDGRTDAPTNGCLEIKKAEMTQEPDVERGSAELETRGAKWPRYSDDGQISPTNLEGVGPSLGNEAKPLEDDSSQLNLSNDQRTAETCVIYDEVSLCRQRTLLGSQAFVWKTLRVEKSPYAVSTPHFTHSTADESICAEKKVTSDGSAAEYEEELRGVFKRWYHSCALVQKPQRDFGGATLNGEARLQSSASVLSSGMCVTTDATEVRFERHQRRRRGPEDPLPSRQPTSEEEEGLLGRGGVVMFGGKWNRTEFCTNEVYLIDLTDVFEPLASVGSANSLGSVRWQLIPCVGDKPCRRFGHTLVYLHPHIILFGGHDGSGLLKDLWTLNTDSWIARRGASLYAWRKVHIDPTPLGVLIWPAPRAFHAAAVMRNGARQQMIIYGGIVHRDFQRSRFYTLTEERPGRWRWAICPVRLKVPQERRCEHSMLVVGSKVFLLGGTSDDVSFDGLSVASYDVKQRNFTYLPKELPQRGQSSWERDGLVYSWGGFDNSTGDLCNPAVVEPLDIVDSLPGSQAEELLRRRFERRLKVLAQLDAVHHAASSAQPSAIDEKDGPSAGSLTPSSFSNSLAGAAAASSRDTYAELQAGDVSQPAFADSRGLAELQPPCSAMPWASGASIHESASLSDPQSNPWYADHPSADSTGCVSSSPVPRLPSCALQHHEGSTACLERPAVSIGYVAATDSTLATTAAACLGSASRTGPNTRYLVCSTGTPDPSSLVVVSEDSVAVAFSAHSPAMAGTALLSPSTSCPAALTSPSLRRSAGRPKRASATRALESFKLLPDDLASVQAPNSQGPPNSSANTQS